MGVLRRPVVLHVALGGILAVCCLGGWAWSARRFLSIPKRWRKIKTAQLLGTFNAYPAAKPPLTIVRDGERFSHMFNICDKLLFVDPIRDKAHHEWWVYFQVFTLATVYQSGR
ncbi:hypothetical protein BDP27DRAFT_689664 [Rhodocollybia butyracea]|uniref:Uncharacterized protein n=1 Tax=Rhodocollybia butyracea TaxID=206335 RepID=A0A9P5TWF3_9AGAR|nr:hypothetical protein BDP27DRAFT_689664 [Rhodocollybia butyracea]